MRAKVINILDSVLSISSKKAQTTQEENNNLIQTTESIRDIEVNDQEEVKSSLVINGVFRPYIGDFKVKKNRFFQFLKTLPKASSYSIHR